MLPEVGALEYLIIAAVALIVVGPKDLPMLLRRLGQFVAKLRGMASEFRASFDEMARQSELDDLRKEVEAMRRGQFADMAEHDELMRSTVGDIQQSLSDVGAPSFDGPETFNYDDAVADAPRLTIGEGPKPAKAARARAKANGAAEPKPNGAAQPATAAKAGKSATPPKPKPAAAATPTTRKPRAAKTVEAES